MKNPANIEVPIIIKIFIKRISLVYAKSASSVKYFSIIFKESPTNLGAIIEKILEIIVIINPRNNFDLYLRRSVSYTHLTLPTKA